MSTTVSWLPGHPSNGSVSMDRYWRELHAQFERTVSTDLAVHCPLGNPPPDWPWPRRSRLVRGWHKYISYPNAVRNFRSTDVVHVLEQGYAYLLSHVRPSTFKIATVHDIVAIHPEYSGLRPHQIALSRRIFQHLRNADLVLADSVASAEDAADRLGLDPTRLAVVPLGVDDGRFRSRRDISLPAIEALGSCPKILSVGSLDHRKNNAILPDVLRSVRRRIPDVALLRVGPPLPEKLTNTLQEILHPGHLVQLGRLTDEELGAVYQASDVYFFPSFFEGFGLPILEAMAADTPVVCSRTTSLPEVGGDAVLYFDPHSAEEGAEQVSRVLHDPSLADSLRERGRSRVRMFSWSRHAQTLQRIYQSRSISAVGSGDDYGETERLESPISISSSAGDPGDDGCE